MKKNIIAILLVALIVPMMVFAATPESIDKTNPEMDIKLSAVTQYRMPLTARAKAMGGAGIALPGGSDAFFLNPAGLAKRVVVLLPSAEVTLYHPYDFLKKNPQPDPSIEGDEKSFFDKVMDVTTESEGLTEEEKQQKLMNLAFDALDLIESDYSKLAEVNAATSFNILGVSMGLNVNDIIHTSGTSAAMNLIDELNVTASIGYGHRFHLGDKLWIDAGLNWRPTYKAYNGAIGASDIVGLIQTTSDGPNPIDKFLDTNTVAAGFAMPFDVGVNFSGSWFSVGLVGRNICGTYNMKAFDSINAFYPNWAEGFGGGDFKIKTPWSLDFGIGFKWDNVFFKPTFVCDIVDINGMFGVEKFDAREFMKHVKAGAEIRLLSCLDVRGGLNQGYWSVGAGLDLAIIKVDVAYYWEEIGKRPGDKGLDALSVRVNIGFDR